MQVSQSVSQSLAGLKCRHLDIISPTKPLFLFPPPLAIMVSHGGEGKDVFHNAAQLSRRRRGKCGERITCTFQLLPLPPLVVVGKSCRGDGCGGGRRGGGNGGWNGGGCDDDTSRCPEYKQRGGGGPWCTLLQRFSSPSFGQEQILSAVRKVVSERRKTYLPPPPLPPFSVVGAIASCL